MTTTESDWMSAEEAAEFLGVRIATLYAWRYKGPQGNGPRGPKSYKAGGVLRYRRSDIEAWLEANSQAGDVEA